MTDQLAVLLARYSSLVNRHGPDSRQAAAFAEEHKDDQEFSELAGVVRLLKKSFVPGKSFEGR